MYKEKIKNLVNVLYFVLGACTYAFAVNMFLSPGGISPGGFTGVAAIINHVTNIPVGAILLVFNIPVLILGWFKLGKKFVFKTSLVTLLISITLDISAKILSPFKTDRILSAMFGGVLMGIGLSLILLRGATTGGVDIIAKLINQKHRHISIGKIFLITDGIVIVLNAFVYKDAESTLYSIVAIYIGTHIMDVLLYGADKGKMLYIITDMPDNICKGINEQVSRGVTKISIVGGYTNNEKTMLLCAARVHEVSEIYNVVNQYDEKAFVVVCDAGEIIGEGFKEKQR